MDQGSTPDPLEDQGAKYDQEEEVAKRKKPVKRTAKYLPTNRITFPKQLDIVRAYGVEYEATGYAVSNDTVAATTGGAPSTVALMNAFLVENGFLTKNDSGNFTPAPEVLEFAKVHAWDEEASVQKLGSLLERTWFAKTLVPKLKFGSKSQDDVLLPLAEVSGATTVHRQQLLILLDFLEAGGVIEKEGEMVRLPAASLTLPPPPASDETPPPPDKHQDNGGVSAPPSDQGMRLTVDINVDMAEISGWEPERITAFFAGIAQVVAAKGKTSRGADSG